MDERLTDAGREFEEMNQNEKTEYLDDFQKQLSEENAEIPRDQTSFLGTPLSSARYEQMEKNALKDGRMADAKRWNDRKVDALVEEETKKQTKAAQGK